ncbi:MAG: hypothetical protein J2P50_11630 [Hyphomicrobiaceae bacterium]|nr:hypothetical protein [Hyphomicrobiaceae bacterium]
MASRIRHVVEPVLGWLFIFAVIFAVGAVMLAATRPRVEMSGPIKADRRR